jgi:hypothetical protein
MFTKLQQCSWIREEVPHRCHVRDWYGLQEACGNDVLLYQTITCWMKPFARVRTLMKVGHILTQPISPVAKIVIIYDEGYCHFSACTGSCLLIYCFETWFVCQQDMFHKFWMNLRYCLQNLVPSAGIKVIWITWQCKPEELIEGMIQYGKLMERSHWCQRTVNRSLMDFPGGHKL